MKALIDKRKINQNVFSIFLDFNLANENNVRTHIRFGSYSVDSKTIKEGE